FNLSYIENSLTSNPVLSKLKSRSPKDVLPLLKIAETGSRDGIELEANYSAEEMNEIIAVMQKMIVVRDIISKVNVEYIRSAAVSDDYRTEPSFKMQGSYRNMNKIVEKILPVMNDKELQTLIISNYENESQTLTDGAEFNMLRFRELFEVLTDVEKERLAAIRKTYEKKQLFSGMDEADPMTQVVVQMGQFTDGLDKISTSISGGMQALPELAAAMTPTQEKAEAPILTLDPHTLEKFSELLQTMQSAVPGKGKSAGALDIVPDEIKIINTVPDFFATILREQLELMRTWMESIHKVSTSNRDEVGALATLIQDVDTKYTALLDHVGGPQKEKVEKRSKGKTL
ncbi:MAG: AAA family ATPase, partial [Lentisphaeraceae bacterium]|nr:AAA family ATPase [Lentisphaeraceae bacterium]